MAVCRAGGVASVASLIGSGPHLAITAPAVAALRLMVDGCSECAAAAVSAGAVAATVELLGQTTDPELLESTLTVRLTQSGLIQHLGTPCSQTTNPRAGREACQHLYSPRGSAEAETVEPAMRMGCSAVC